MRKMSLVLFVAVFAAMAVFGSARHLYADDGAVFAKLTEIGKNQEKILQSLEEIKSELAIVKVRATLKG